jgi:hypothetical protein
MTQRCVAPGHLCRWVPFLLSSSSIFDGRFSPDEPFAGHQHVGTPFCGASIVGRYYFLPPPRSSPGPALACAARSSIDPRGHVVDGGRARPPCRPSTCRHPPHVAQSQGCRRQSSASSIKNMQSARERAHTRENAMTATHFTPAALTPHEHDVQLRRAVVTSRSCFILFV